MTTRHQAELDRGERFAFGENWSHFLTVLNDERIAVAEASLRHALRTDSLDGLRFLDAGSGSGLFSLAARRLGASVVSFDFDPASVACTQELRRRYFPDDPEWRIEQGSVLDLDFLASLGSFDVVYSWGVLHHTGAMWNALDRVALLVRPNGRLYVSIYNDQGVISGLWRRVKELYNQTPAGVQPLVVVGVAGVFEARALLVLGVRGRFADYVRRWTHYQSARGMSRWHDYVDWVGGLPFEVARPADLVEFARGRGFTLDWLRTVGGSLGCNEYVFVRTPAPSPLAPRAGAPD